MKPGIPLAVILAALVLVSAAPAAQAGVVFDGRWHAPEAGSWNGILQLKAGNRNTLRYVTVPRRRPATYAADLRVGGSATSERIEFQKIDLFPAAEGKDHWWAWSLRIARDSVVPSIAFLTQIYSPFNGTYCSIPRGGASNSLRMMNPVAGRPSNRWYWTVTGGSGRCEITQIRIPRLRVVKGRWIDFSCHFRWSSTPAGLSRCYYRVQPRRRWRRAFDHRGANLVAPPGQDAPLRVSQGLYKAEAPPYVHVLQGGLVVADTRREAETAAFGRRGPVVVTSSAAGGAPSPLLGAVAAVVIGAALLPALWRRRRRRLRRRPRAMRSARR